MFSLCTTRNNGIAYLLWRWLLRRNGKFTAWLDSFYFGHSRGLNDYNVMAARYTGSNVKPDKRYSILPTVMEMVGDCTGKTVIDLGCGTGFFTVPIAEAGDSAIIGIDNSVAQIKLAREYSAHPAIRYCVADIFTQSGGPADIFTAPFVANYARTVPILRHFLSLVFDSLNKGGKMVLVVDLPNGKSLKRFGATKSFDGPVSDETSIQINLFNGDVKICTLDAVYYTPRTIEALLHDVGFSSVEWTKPILAKEGVQAYGSGFWDEYLGDPELGYITAGK